MDINTNKGVLKVKMKDYKVVLIALLVGITIFSGFKYFSALKEKYDLLENLSQLNSQIAKLENEKHSLAQEIDKEKELQRLLYQENLQFKGDLNLNKAKLAQLATEFQTAQKLVEELNSQISLAKIENVALREQIESLRFEVIQTAQEKEILQARLGSIEELKQVIKELQQKMRLAKKDLKIRTKAEVIIIGNRGYLIKDGKSTYPSKVKIEVHPFLREN